MAKEILSENKKAYHAQRAICGDAEKYSKSFQQGVKCKKDLFRESLKNGASRTNVGQEEF